MAKFDRTRYRPLPEVARKEGIPQATLRFHASREPGLAVKRLGRLYIDTEMLARLLRPAPLVAAAQHPSQSK